jgi:hypothetical protein
MKSGHVGCMMALEFARYTIGRFGNVTRERSQGLWADSMMN